jgi:hypothetical protein
MTDDEYVAIAKRWAEPRGLRPMYGEPYYGAGYSTWQWLLPAGDNPKEHTLPCEISSCCYSDSAEKPLWVVLGRRIHRLREELVDVPPREFAYPYRGAIIGGIHV